VEGERSRLVTLRFPPRAPATSAQANPGTTAAQTAGEPSSASAIVSPAEHHVALGAWVLGGFGVLSLGAGGAFALVTNNDLNGLKASCSPNCSQAATNPGRTHEVITYASLGVGGAALGGALLWALVFPSSSPGHAHALEGLHLEVLPIAGGAMTSVGASY
jgi:hypothetical protein